MDYPLDNKNSYKLLLYALTRRDFVTMRIEKSGMGDSQGPPCSAEDFRSQTHGYEEAIKSLQQLEFVDKNKIFVFGHSIGGIVAPILAARFPLCGIVVADTVGLSWFEYELQNSRRQKTLAGLPPEQIDRLMRTKEVCLHCLLVDKKTPEQIVKEHQDCKEDTSYPAHYTYIQQLADLNLPHVWTSVPCPVLVIFGTSDYVTSDNEHTSILAQINAVHPGNGTLLRVQGMDHFLTRAKTSQASFARQASGETGDFDYSIVPSVSAWMHKICASRHS
jgi:pimeloyl-ACP methyl ester carboxylesterase